MNRAILITTGVVIGGIALVGGGAVWLFSGIIGIDDESDAASVVALEDVDLFPTGRDAPPADAREQDGEVSSDRPSRARSGESPRNGAQPNLRMAYGAEFSFTRELAFSVFDMSDLRVDEEEIFAGADIDSIPALSTPDRVAADEFTGLDAAREQVIVVRHGDEIVGYPMAILNHHEIVNDVVGGKPLAVTYCPLCDSIAVFQRQIETREITEEGAARVRTLNFGVSGLLTNSNAIMYDKSFRGLWTQVGMECISGPLAGMRLQSHPFAIMTFGEFQDRHADDGLIVSLRTGYIRDYAVNPHASEARRAGENASGGPVRHHDARLPAGTRGFGLVDRNTRRAIFIPLESLELVDGDLRVTLDSGSATLRDGGVVQSDESIDATASSWFGWTAYNPSSEIWTAED